MRSSVFLLVVSVSLVAATVSAQPAYYPNGPQNGVPESTVTDGGWTECFRNWYPDSSADLSDVLDGCQGTYMMLACRYLGDGNDFTVLAAALRTDVLMDTGSEAAATNNANGSEWYFHQGNAATESMGFAGGGDTVNRNSCDIEDTDVNERLCWHLNTDLIDDGWSCGEARDSRSTDDYQRLIYVDSATAQEVPVASRWQLAVLALLLTGAALASRRVWARSS